MSKEQEELLICNNVPDTLMPNRVVVSGQEDTGEAIAETDPDLPYRFNYEDSVRATKCLCTFGLKDLHGEFRLFVLIRRETKEQNEPDVKLHHRLMELKPLEGYDGKHHFAFDQGYASLRHIDFYPLGADDIRPDGCQYIDFGVNKDKIISSQTLRELILKDLSDPRNQLLALKCKD